MANVTQRALLAGLQEEALIRHNNLHVGQAQRVLAQLRGALVNSA